MPNLIITPKGKNYQRKLNRKMGSDPDEPGPLLLSEEDDWDVLYEMEYRIGRQGSVTPEFILAMPDRNQALGTDPPGHWMAEETRSKVRATLRRLFEEGYIEYA